MAGASPQFPSGMKLSESSGEWLARRVLNDFKFHPATPTTGPKHDAVRAACLGLANTLLTIVPESREQSLMLTNLEQAMFWANAGIARQA